MSEEPKSGAPKEPKPKKPGKPEESGVSRFGKWWSNKFGEYKSEFKKIVWPSRMELLKSSVTVVIVCAIFGLYLAGVDTLIGAAFTQFVQLINR